MVVVEAGQQRPALRFEHPLARTRRQPTPERDDEAALAAHVAACAFDLGVADQEPRHRAGLAYFRRHTVIEAFRPHSSGCGARARKAGW